MAVLAAEDVSRGIQACSATQYDPWQRAAPSGRHGKSAGASVSLPCSSSYEKSSFEQVQPLGLAERGRTGKPPAQGMISYDRPFRNMPYFYMAWPYG